MSAVWRAARAAVRRRRLQTFVIGLVVFASSVVIVVALGLLEAASAPFDRAFDRQQGAHVVASFDPDKVSQDELRGTAERPGVAAVAGPFKQAVLEVPEERGHPSGPVVVVGRADPGGEVDRVSLSHGRWAERPGEIVFGYGFQDVVGQTLTFDGGLKLKVVGVASSVSRSGEAWVVPGQIEALHPNATQLLYRFDRSATAGQLEASLKAATAELPAKSLAASQTYLAVKKDVGWIASAYVPFLMGFGILGLIVAVLIVANVVSGAVVSGFRHIGVLKALGFTPNQVAAVYLVMVLTPAAVGGILGTFLGGLAAEPLLDGAFNGIQAEGLDVGMSSWVYVVTLAGMPAVVALAALAPALRAHHLSAARAISAGSAPTAGRGRRVQRWLAGTRLPRSVSLGLGWPFARPGRSGLTLSAVLLGVTTVTLATGLSSTLADFGETTLKAGRVDTTIGVGQPDNGERAPKHTDSEVEKLLLSLPGAERVSPSARVPLKIAGYAERSFGEFYRGDQRSPAARVVKGRWLRGPGEAVVGSQFLAKHDLELGDRVSFTLNGKQRSLTLVGLNVSGNSYALQADWADLAALAPNQRATHYEVGLAPGADVAAYDTAVKKADPGLLPDPMPTTNGVTTGIIGMISVLTLLLAIVAALGVFNTVVLNTRDRRRDLGMLKSIGMTPRQVTSMVVTSMAALGLVGGLIGIPLGMGAYHLVLPAMIDAAELTLPEGLMDVWHAPQLVAMALAGVALAVLGALIPARSAARLTIAKVLHNE
ncbi:ABC transporter permease [Streptomyces sp. NBC_01304]|uniref:ABC transporter permease n=1 Tax=Streptomyces sp. NBC_01304 TaxID=2903818 RepID=UPI002E159CA1|nr:ABC transporter permease [Streptomyces sp. NBC_01304]